MDAIVISDLHLGSDICRAEQIESFLKEIPKTKKLILNGDVFDDLNFKRLKKRHWRVLSLIRKLSDQIDVIWISGNHDGNADIVSHLLGVNVVNNYILLSGDKIIYFHHGHKYDYFTDNHVILTFFADTIYWFLQKIDKSHYLARSAKKASRTFLRNSEIIQQKSIEYAKKHGYDIVCCGHSHYALEVEGKYYNSGSWTELPCTYLTVEDGEVRLHHYPY